MTPLLDAILPWVRSQIAEPPETLADEDARRADAQLVRRVLTSEDGPAFLELLAKLSVLRPPLDPSLSGAASHDYAQRRTGENQLFAALIFYRDLADQLERTDHDRRRQSFDFGWGGRDDANAGGGVDDERWDPSGTVAGA